MSISSPLSLERFVKLDNLKLNGNDLETIETLQIQSHKLTVLELEGNRIAKIAGLPTSLVTLSLSDNLISKLENASHLKSLVRLYLEGNQISSFEGFQHLTGLMELYMSKNNISQLMEILHLRNLSRLLVLTLSENPVEELPNYRCFCLFHLSKIKILDGISVDSEEQLEARDMFAGKLTEEELMEHIGTMPETYQQVKTVDLSDLSIEKVSILDSSRFVNLRVLNLDKNKISDLTYFRPLPHLWYY